MGAAIAKATAVPRNGVSEDSSHGCSSQVQRIQTDIQALYQMYYRVKVQVFLTRSLQHIFLKATACIGLQAVLASGSCKVEVIFHRAGQFTNGNIELTLILTIPNRDCTFIAPSKDELKIVIF